MIKEFLGCFGLWVLGSFFVSLFNTSTSIYVVLFRDRHLHFLLG